MATLRVNRGISWIAVFLLSIAILLLLSHARGAPDLTAVKTQGPDSLGNPMPVLTTPAGASGVTRTFLTSSSTGGATANNCTLTGAAGVTCYVTGFTVSGGGATSASIISVTLTNTISGTMNYSFGVATGATQNSPNLNVQFTEPIPASAANTTITLNVPSFGAGNTAASAVLTGFRQ